MPGHKRGSSSQRCLVGSYLANDNTNETQIPQRSFDRTMPVIPANPEAARSPATTYPKVQSTINHHSRKQHVHTTLSPSYKRVSQTVFSVSQLVRYPYISTARTRHPYSIECSFECHGSIVFAIAKLFGDVHSSITFRSSNAIWHDAVTTG